MYTGNCFCDFCIDCMVWWSRHTPLSYGAINVLLFVVIEPLLVCFYMVTTIWTALTRNHRTKKALLIAAVSVFVLFILGTLALVCVPLLAAPSSLL